MEDRESMAELFEKLPTGEEIDRGRLTSVIVGGGKRRRFVIILRKTFENPTMTGLCWFYARYLRMVPSIPLKYVKDDGDVSSYVSYRPFSLSNVISCDGGYVWRRGGVLLLLVRPDLISVRL